MESWLREEQSHIEYLYRRLEEWNKTGKVTAEALRTAVPSKKTISAGIGKLTTRMKDEDREAELQMLSKALAVERDTSDFYKRMVDELPRAARRLFSRFVEIEDGHLAIVQAQMDHINKTGYWFDFREFDFEGE